MRMIGWGLCLALAAALGAAARAETASGVDWVTLPAGRFTMGFGARPKWPWIGPEHAVTIKAFQMARSAATFRQYDACVKAGACTPPHLSDGKCYAYDGSGRHWAPRKLPAAFLGDDKPVVCVDWLQARAFCRWAGGRLPSEAEWEYAARSAGRDILYPWGDEPSSCERAIIPDPKAGGEGCGRRSTWDVCSRPKGDTAQGLCDMSGNVWAWMEDSYHRSYAGAPADGSAWGSPPEREIAAGAYAARPDGSAWGRPTRANPVARGGSWRIAAGFDRAAFRFPLIPVFGYSTGGIRPVRDLPAGDGR